MLIGPAIVVHSLAHAVAVLQAAAEAGRPVLLLSAVDAGLSAGAGWWREAIAAARNSAPASQATVQSAALLDCGNDAGGAQAALRAGVEAIVFTGGAEVAARLADIARQRGSQVRHERPLQALDLVDDFFSPPELLRRRVLAILRGEDAETAGLRVREAPRHEGPVKNRVGTMREPGRLRYQLPRRQR